MRCRHAPGAGYRFQQAVDDLRIVEIIVLEVEVGEGFGRLRDTRGLRLDLGLSKEDGIILEFLQSGGVESFEAVVGIIVHCLRRSGQ